MAARVRCRRLPQRLDVTAIARRAAARSAGSVTAAVTDCTNGRFSFAVIRRVLSYRRRAFPVACRTSGVNLASRARLSRSLTSAAPPCGPNISRRPAAFRARTALTVAGRPVASRWPRPISPATPLRTSPPGGRTAVAAICPTLPAAQPPAAPPAPPVSRPPATAPAAGSALPRAARITQSATPAVSSTAVAAATAPGPPPNLATLARNAPLNSPR